MTHVVFSDSPATRDRRQVAAAVRRAFDRLAGSWTVTIHDGEREVGAAELGWRVEICRPGRVVSARLAPDVLRDPQRAAADLIRLVAGRNGPRSRRRVDS